MKRIRIIGLCLVAVALIWAQSAEGAPVGAFTEFLIPTAKSSSTSITAGPDGNLWFAEREASKIGRITPSGTISEFPLPPYANPNPGFTVVPSQPFGITAGRTRAARCASAGDKSATTADRP